MELLAPAGNWEAFVAAINNGADAVYLGGKNYNARKSADNFSNKEVERALRYAHLGHKKVFITVNTLVADQEIESVLDYVKTIYDMGADAVIVQDLGLLQAIRQLLPSLPVHASTQMTVHNLESALFLQDLGVKRIVLARELTWQEIKSLCQRVQVELEAFIHGALCYSYSGQCMFSSMVGGRSGNRGKCAQPCRLPYELYSNLSGKKISTGGGRYLLSPADLCLIEYLPRLQETGIKSLKIEGRMKRPEYVAVVTRVYREALDLLDEGQVNIAELKRQLLKIYNRNFTSGHFIQDRANFLSTNRPNNRGIFIGRIIKQNSDGSTSIKLKETVKVGDGLDIWVAKGKGPSFILKEMRKDGKKVNEAGPNDLITIKIEEKVGPNDRVFKTHDQELISMAAQSIETVPEKKILVDVEAYLEINQPLRLKITDERGHTVEVSTENNGQKAEKYPLTTEILRQKIDRMGNTIFKLRRFSFTVGDTEKELVVPFSDINKARRQGIELLEEINMRDYNRTEPTNNEYQTRKDSLLNIRTNSVGEYKTRLSITVSSIETADTAIDMGADRVYILLEGFREHKKILTQDIKKLQEKAGPMKVEIVPVMPRIQKEAEDNYWKTLEEAGCNILMGGNLGTIKWCLDHQIQVRADYSLNIFNSWTVEKLFEAGVVGACLSPELNFRQLETMCNFDKLEILVHGELPLMVSQYCMLSGVLTAEGKPCRKECLLDDYYLRDDKGYKFPIATNAYCHFYLFNSRTLCMIDDLERVLRLRPESIRIEAHRLNRKQVAGTVRLYRKALDEIVNGIKSDLDHYKQELTRFCNSPYTKCHYYRGVLNDE